MRRNTPATPKSESGSWAYDIAIPTQFSARTMRCIEQKVLTAKARDEIIT